MSKKQRKNAWKIWIAILVAMIAPLIMAKFYDGWKVKASDVVNPFLFSFNDPHPELPQLPSTVVETITWAFKDKGGAVVNQALLVARCESGNKVEAANTTKNKDKTRDDGVFQINSIHGVSPRFLHDLKVNVMVARKLYDEQGWNPWRSSNKCHHLLNK